MIPVVNIANNILEARAGRAQKLSDDEIFRLVTDSLSLVTSTNQSITSRRRELIKTDLKDEYKSLCANKLDETKSLLGEDLLQKVPNINTTNKVTNQLIQRPYGRGRSYYSGYGRGNRCRYTPYYNHGDGYFKRCWTWTYGFFRPRGAWPRGAWPRGAWPTPSISAIPRQDDREESATISVQQSSSASSYRS
ncbi:uncharacterized protein LOC117316116 [Pecten maximus]|uniref:uncharacterized protein LOC117316116 n=1 Tax=Pecten maximus TaxID=6579 RepID=UPI0014583BE3|nr:uncharacterized protein LOC117316116 [Pecten maximus]